MEPHKDQATVDKAADDIAEYLSNTLITFRPTLAKRYTINERLVNIAIAKAGAQIAVASAGQAAGLDYEHCRALLADVTQLINDSMRKGNQ